MRVVRTALGDVVEIMPVRHGDSRGYFSETFRADWFAANVANVGFVQENESRTQNAGVIRGLHFQSAPYAQGKLVRCIAGAIFDVAIDIRRGSPEFGNWVGITISADQGNQLWIPPGFLHGFGTLSANTIVSYKVTSYYSKPNDLGVRWNDPDIKIVWPSSISAPLLSEKDQTLPLLRELPSYFEYRAGEVE